ncbi:hypothetical protein SNOG_04542 [Parastagonospora nodorum SN15]|uniref:Uncharacterized protein n=1 Tax=Phaeosphaeria nodorum (strain SN15 / ATCC MYA-4574 / FGSC 10173) TaxID=321614 RepID=Q0UUM2_PHANO|nr:hypothetical protein SNOG_04542 [Parastagonospora nodorum SN15]EAT88302.1 hypothetical protein SNOG_04542 [Parastagonospora nodorum SN15]
MAHIVIAYDGLWTIQALEVENAGTSMDWPAEDGG